MLRQLRCHAAAVADSFEMMDDFAVPKAEMPCFR